MSKTTKYAFCEPAYATSLSKWHIRPLTGRGFKLGGGADRLSLCGRVMCWDLTTAITPHHLPHACPECVGIYRKEMTK